MHDHNMDLVALSNEPKMKRLYELFLGSYSVDDLTFVGLTEQYDRSLALYEKIFGRKLERKKVNVGTVSAYKDTLQQQGILSAVEKSQAVNQRIYQAAQERFEKLCETFGV